MVLTMMQYLGLAAYPMSIASLAMGSLTYQKIKDELNNNLGFMAKAHVAPFFLVVSFTKIWTLTEFMTNLHEVDVNLTLFPVIAVALIQYVLHLAMKVDWQDSFFCTIGNLSSLRRPENNQKVSLRLFKFESLISAITYGLMAFGSYELHQSGHLDKTKTLTSTYISVGLLVAYILVTQSYLWFKCLRKTLFTEDELSIDLAAEGIKLGTLPRRHSDGSQQGSTQGGVGRIRGVGEGNTLHQRQGQSGTTEGPTPDENVSAYWLALPMVFALVIQFSLVAYFGYSSGEMKPPLKKIGKPHT